MKRVFSFLIVMSLLILTSCQTVVNVDIPAQPSLLVFNGNAIAKDSLNIFRLSKSRGVLEAVNYQYDTATGTVYQFDPVTDGQIVLYENDVAVDTLHHEVIFRKGDYPTRFIFHSGNTYRIDASGGGLSSVNALTTIPIAVVPLITSYNPDSYVDNNGSKIGELKFTIPDPASENNYYQLRLNIIDSGFQVSSISFNSNDPALNVDASSDSYGGFSGVSETSFDDHLFNGIQRSFTVNLQGFNLSPTFGLEVQLISLDRSAYLYDQSLKLQQSTEGNPFAEPAPVFNNIENGYGIFGSVAVARDTIF